MKKTFTLLFILVAFTGAFAQKGNFGIKLGITGATLYGRDAYGAGSVTGYHGGLYFNSDPKKELFLKHDFLVNSFREVSGDFAYQSLRLDALPIAVGYNLKGLRFYGGPLLSLIFLDQVTHTDKKGEKHTTDMMEYVNPLDVGLAIGTEYEFKFGLNISARFQNGFVSVEPKEVGQKETAKIFNRGFMFSLGYTFGASKSNKD